MEETGGGRKGGRKSDPFLPFPFLRFLYLFPMPAKDTVAQRVLDYHFNLNRSIQGLQLPKGVDWLFPYSEEETRRVMTEFYNRYYNDSQPRMMIFGINPGRFGAGLTGVPFTDPVKMKEVCRIENEFNKKPELSAQFIYAMIETLGGVGGFYRKFYITSLSPLGFVKDGINYNYYDDPTLARAVRPFIIRNIRDQIKIAGSDSDKAYCLGEGKNFQYFSKLNGEHHFFREIIPLPHPRWIMQYRRKSMEKYLDLYRERLSL